MKCKEDGRKPCKKVSMTNVSCDECLFWKEEECLGEEKICCHGVFLPNKDTSYKEYVMIFM